MVEVQEKQKRPIVEPNVVDRVVTWFSPVAGAKRFRARAFMALSGAYLGAKKNRRGTKNWKTSNGDADDDLLWDLPVLRERSRDLCRNDSFAGAAVNTNVTNVIGTGLKPRPRIDYKYLHMNEDQAREWERNARAEWSLWADSSNCDVARTLNFYEMQELGWRQTLENGDVLLIITNKARPGWPYQTCLQAIEADRLSNPDHKGDGSKLENGNHVYGGVEKDENGAPIIYHVQNIHPGTYRQGMTREWAAIPAWNDKTGLRNVIHLFQMLRPGQSRGIPYLAPVIEALKQLGKFMESELMAAVISSMFTVFVKSETGGEGLDEPTSDTGGSAEEKRNEYRLDTGAIIDLAQDESIEIANPSRPNSQFDPFFIAITRQIAARLEQPHEIILKHVTSSYTAARAAFLQAYQYWRTRQRFMNTRFNNPMYEIVLSEAVARGRLKAPGWFRDPRVRQAYLGVQWIGDGQGHLNPAVEANAADTRIKSLISTVDRETMLWSGEDFDQNMAQIRAEQGFRDELQGGNE